MTTDASKIWRETASLTLSATRTPAPEGEVVAWRVRGPRGGWMHSDVLPVSWRNAQPLYASHVVPVGREDIEIVSEWLEIAKETPKPLHSSLNYVPVCASEIEAIERILAALRPTDTGWRDIATAPKDGRRVLAFLNPTASKRGYGYTEVGHFGLVEGVGRAWLRFDGRAWAAPEVVTHWMPLPPAPTDTGRE